MVLWGLWSVRPQTRGAGDGSGGPSPLVGSSPTAAERPALRPIEPVLDSVPPVPHTDTGAVGHLELTPRVGEEESLPDSYTIVGGDTLGLIATRFEISLDDLMELNGITDPNTLQVGQVLLLPRRVALAAPYQKLLPDSEVILSPTYQDFDLCAFVTEQGGFLTEYREVVEGSDLDGVEIIERVSQRYSVGPRPLVAMLEYQSGWVTQKEPEERAYPMGLKDPARAGLFFQLSWAANRLNQGYYGKFTGRDLQLYFKDGTRALYDEETNPGTAALQNVFAVGNDPDAWGVALAEDGFYATYLALFGDPWARVVEPLIPESLEQPTLALPWSSGEIWYYTGGPHGGWGDLSGWAALDFVPTETLGCEAATQWATAAAAGKVIRSENGEVVLDLDGDGFVGTGWTLLYMHMASAGRAGLGSEVERGDIIGRPSCEGGFSDAAHLHIARRYNGQWIEADGATPFMLGEWRAQFASKSYDGYLVRGDEQREACACRQEELNGIRAP